MAVWPMCGFYMGLLWYIGFHMKHIFACRDFSLSFVWERYLFRKNP